MRDAGSDNKNTYSTSEYVAGPVEKGPFQIVTESDQFKERFLRRKSSIDGGFEITPEMVKLAGQDMEKIEEGKAKWKAEKETGNIKR